MTETCTHDCSSCAVDCASREEQKESFLAEMNPMSDVKKVIGVVSGKGGVGKSLVAAGLAVLLNRKNYKTAILDADITGPSIPKIFDLHQQATANEWGILPLVSKTGISIISVNMLLEDESSPVVWRGPVIAGAVKQFWSDVVWGEVDYMLVDMPPGTGDVPLTVFQSLPLDGIVIVTSPQELVASVVEKAVNMAKMMDIPILGLLENMSYLVCPDCGKKLPLFGESHAAQTAQKYGVPLLGQIPLDPTLAAACDAGQLEQAAFPWLEYTADMISRL